MRQQTAQARAHQRAKNTKVHAARTQRAELVKALGPDYRDLMAAHRYGKPRVWKMRKSPYKAARGGVMELFTKRLYSKGIAK